MSKSTTILNFFKRKNLNNFEVIADDDCQPLALMSQFLKISKQKFQMSPLMKVQVLCVILECISKYGNMMLMNRMKFEELTLSLVYSNLNQMSTRKLNLEVILVNLNIHGLQLRNLVHGLQLTTDFSTLSVPFYLWKLVYSQRTQIAC